MASSTTSVLVGVEDTTPQTQHFDTIREFDDDTIREFDDSEEGFIDVSVDDDEDNAQIMVEDYPDGDDEEEGERASSPLEMTPLLLDTNNNDGGNIPRNDITTTPPSPPAKIHSPIITQMRSRHNKSGGAGNDSPGTPRRSIKRSCLKRKQSRDSLHGYERMDVDTSSAHSSLSESSQMSGRPAGCRRMRRFCRESSTHFLRTTVSVMNFMARILLWGSFVAMVVGVVWYSRELKMNGTDPHLIAWFSAGAFVLLGFPISMFGIIMHLKNYYQPNVQCYVVRILWMVPIYSIESWLCLRFHTLAIYIETLRDCYESYVLYSFFQFLIEVLGGEESLVLMLKDKSPTRGAHIWGLGYFVKPWIMGQPVSRHESFTPVKTKHGMGGSNLMSNGHGQFGPASPSRPIKRIQWTSPFFVKCKFGVLQYVLLKFVSSIFVMLLEMYGLYKEGDFTPRGGYLYICILTNLSQCWALYCLVFFYYALKNELGPIRPVGKFLSVKALVFATWWQSLGIAILFQMGMIPHYTSFDNGREWTSEAVAKGLQDWLICIEMFCAAIVHTFVFPHTDYLEPLGIVKQRASNHIANGARRLGRKGRPGYRRGDDKSACSKNSSEAEFSGALDLELGSGDLPMTTLQGGNGPEFNGGCSTVEETDKDSTGSGGNSGENPRHQRQGFVSALLDSTVPRDVLDESVGIFKGDFNVEKKTLLHHAATSDEYDLFSKSSKRRKANKANLRSAQVAAVQRKIKEKKAHHSTAGVPNSVLLND